jgi:hypothetical protein
VARTEPVAKTTPSSPEIEQPKRGRLGRRKKTAEPVGEAKRSRVQRSSPEAGMEEQDVTFMQDLSSRLSAYSISPDEPIAIPVPAPVAQDSSDDGEPEDEPKPDYLK